MKPTLLLVFVASLIIAACSSPQCSGGGDCTIAYDEAGVDNPDESSLDAIPFIVALTFSETLTGIKAAAAGNPGTFVMEQGRYMVFVWQQGIYPAFAVLEANSFTPVENFVLEGGGNGAQTDLKSMGDLINYMKDTGWRYVPKGDIPTWLAATVEEATIWNALGAPYMPTFIFLPVGADPLDYIDSVRAPEIIQ